MPDNTLKKFSEKTNGKLFFDYDLKKTNWFNIGGNAKVFFKPGNLKDLINFLKNFGNKEKIFILGAGSNILIKDQGFDGTVIKLGKNFSNISILPNRTIVAGSASIDKKVVARVKKFAKGKKRILIFLDSAHTFEHVLEELKSYSSLVKRGSYIVVFDTVAENFPTSWFKKNGTDRSLNKTNNPKTSVHEFLKLNNRFKIDKEFQRKLLITSAPDGFLKCVK